MQLSDYILKAMAKQGKNPHGNESVYFFGDNYVGGWEVLLGQHAAPPFARGNMARSFGVGGVNSGVPFHFHGPGYAEVFHGRKRWCVCVCVCKYYLFVCLSVFLSVCMPISVCIY